MSLPPGAPPSWLGLFSRELQLPVGEVVRVEEGWDSLVFEIDGEWIVRVPRRPEIEALLRREVSLLAALAPTLSVSVPRLRLLVDGELCCVAYRKIEGTRIDAIVATGIDKKPLAIAVGRFLAELHRFPRERAVACGLPPPDAAGWAGEQQAFRERCERDVYPLLDRDERTRADTIFDRYLAAVPNDLELHLVHADFGPAHILCDAGGLRGVIDWSDAQLGDPAIDFGWPLHGLGPRFAATLRAAYRDAGGSADAAFCARALFYHRLGPWYEVLYGLEHGERCFVDSGLAGVRARLPDRYR